MEISLGLDGPVAETLLTRGGGTPQLLCVSLDYTASPSTSLCITVVIKSGQHHPQKVPLPVPTVPGTMGMKKSHFISPILSFSYYKIQR